MTTKNLSSDNPVPLEEHQRIFKETEEKIITYLDEHGHEDRLIGLRVAYDVLDSSNKPGVLPYSIEFGYSEPVNCTMQASQDDLETWLNSTSSGVSLYPLPRDFMIDLYNETKSALEGKAQKRLVIGIFVMLYKSFKEYFIMRCGCGSDTGRLQECWTNPFTGKCVCECRSSC